jgi:hypothetical protein
VVAVVTVVAVDAAEEIVEVEEAVAEATDSAVIVAGPLEEAVEAKEEVVEAMAIVEVGAAVLPTPVVSTSLLTRTSPPLGRNRLHHGLARICLYDDLEHI